MIPWETRYEDLTRKQGRVGSLVTTEDPFLLRSWAAACAPDRVLGVAGGGESVLLGFLPTGAEVTGIDIARDSLTITMMKAMLVERYETPRLKEVIGKGSLYFTDLADRELRPSLPASLQPYALRLPGRGLRPWRNGRYRFSPDVYQTFRNLWASTPDSVLDRARANLHRLRLVHDDLHEYAGRGRSYPFVYGSNAVGWPGPARATADDLLRLTEAGGYLLTSQPLPAQSLAPVQQALVSRHAYRLYHRNSR